MDAYRSEEEQVEAIKKWWKENGNSIIAGIVIGFGAIFGWRAWESHTVTQAEAASTLYEQMLSASRDNEVDNVKNYAERIIADYQSTTYGIFAKLMMAKLAAENNDLATAEDDLRWVINNASQDEYKHIARLRLVRVLISKGSLDEALSMLNSSSSGEFVSQYEEVRGDILLQQGKVDEAKQAYEKALTNTAAGEDAQSILQLKLDELGRT